MVTQIRRGLSFKMSVGFIAVVAFVLMSAGSASAYIELSGNSKTTPFTVSAGDSYTGLQIRAGSGTVNMTGGTITGLSYLGYGSQSSNGEQYIFNLSGGTLTNTSGNCQLLTDGGAYSTNVLGKVAISGYGYFKQTGGDLNFGSQTYGAGTTVVLDISGHGTFIAGNGSTNSWIATGTAGATFINVTGGDATIQFSNPYMNNGNGSCVMGGMTFNLDGSTNHISTITTLGSSYGWDFSNAGNIGKFDLNLSGFTPTQNQTFNLMTVNTGQYLQVLNAGNGGVNNLLNTTDKTAWALSLTNGGKTLTATYLLASGNNSKIWVGGTEPTGSLEVTNTTLAFGNVLRNAVATLSAQASKNGTDTTSATVVATDGVAAYTGSSPITFAGGVDPKSISVGLNTTTMGDYTSGTNRVTIDNQAADSAGTSQGSNNGNAYINVTAVVGWATATSSSNTATFGASLSATTTTSPSYAGLESLVHAVTGSGGGPVLSSKATILAGSNTSGSDTGVVMAWRTRVLGESSSITEGGSTRKPLLADVVDLSGMVNSGGTQTDQFVLQMTYDPSLLVPGVGVEANAAAAGDIYLASLIGGVWVNAIAGNQGSNVGATNVQGAYSGQTALGTWGVDIGNNVVWAVVDHNSQFSVMPEPATMALMGLGVLGMALNRRRNRKA